MIETGNSLLQFNGMQMRVLGCENANRVQSTCFLASEIKPFIPPQHSAPGCPLFCSPSQVPHSILPLNRQKAKLVMKPQGRQKTPQTSQAFKILPYGWCLTVCLAVQHVPLEKYLKNEFDAKSPSNFLRNRL